MASQQVGMLHPGDMGISIAASALQGGRQVAWVSAGRSASTAERAARFGLRDAGTLVRLCAECGVIISVCPPHAAEAVAHDVIAAGFSGLYLDANAIAPARALAIGQALAAAGVAFVDGGIIGGPAWEPGRTILYLSGPRAGELAACFSAGPLAARVLDEQIGTASALKMCFAAYTKGTSALLCAILATAERLGVREALAEQWAHDDPAFAKQAIERARQVTAKAWRFAGEMDEIASTFEVAGLPGGFHTAAADVYRRLAGFKGAAATPALAEVLAALLRDGDG